MTDEIALGFSHAFCMSEALMAERWLTGEVPGLREIDVYVGLYRLCRAGDWEGARAEQERLCALFGIVGVGDPARMGGSSAALGAFKAALHLRGVITCPATAEPQVPLSGDEVARVGKLLAGAGLL